MILSPEIEKEIEKAAESAAPIYGHNNATFIAGARYGFELGVRMAAKVAADCVRFADPADAFNNVEPEILALLECEKGEK